MDTTAYVVELARKRWPELYDDYHGPSRQLGNRVLRSLTIVNTECDCVVFPITEWNPSSKSLFDAMPWRTLRIYPNTKIGHSLSAGYDSQNNILVIKQSVPDSREAIGL